MYLPAAAATRARTQVVPKASLSLKKFWNASNALPADPIKPPKSRPTDAVATRSMPLPSGSSRTANASSSLSATRDASYRDKPSEHIKVGSRRSYALWHLVFSL